MTPAQVAEVPEVRAGAGLPGQTVGEDGDSELGDFIEDSDAVDPPDAVSSASCGSSWTRCWTR